MDFQSLLSAQIAQSGTSSSGPSSSNKYLKKSEVEAQRHAKYVAEQKAQQDERVMKLEKKRKYEEEEAERNRARDEKRRRLADESRRLREEEEQAEERTRRKRLGLPDLPAKNGTLEGTPLPEGEEDIEDDDLILRLRGLGEPARLFGEAHIARLRRYRRLTSRTLAPTISRGPIPTTLILVPEAEMKVPDTVPEDIEGRSFLLRQLGSYFTMVLSEWQHALSRREDGVKSSTSGKAAYNAMVLARDNMVPLFRRLEKGELEKGILEPVVEIVRCCQRRRYVDANDAYLRLSIGKAAWPIGVTMVGIHERSAREKLHGNDKDAAHIMSDEITRKFLQSIKRCLSFAQTRWPPDDQLQLMG